MKKLIALLLVLAMALTLAACGGETAPETTAAPAETYTIPLTLIFVKFFSQIRQIALFCAIRFVHNFQ